MPNKSKSERLCPACGSRTDTGATRCTICGADLEPTALRGTPSVDDDLSLRYVDPGNRIELDRFPRLEEAELACGLLRSSGIPCELSSSALPGLSTDTILWVNNQDAKLAWALLADMERRTSREDNELM